MNILPQLCVVGVVVAGIALATPAHAQKIRTYGDQSSSSSSGDGGSSSSAGSAGGAGWYPGMPQPSSSDQGGQASGQQQQQQQGEGGEDEGVTGTYRVRMYGGSPSSATGPRTTLDLTIDKLYRGVIPGKRDEVEHLKSEDDDAMAGANRLTWLGFQPEQTRTRIFIQTSRQADYDQSVNAEEKTLTLTMYNTELSDRNFSRFVDTSFFDRNIQRIEAGEQGESVEISIAMNEVERPTVQQDGKYLYLDFQHESDEEKDTSSSGQSDSN